MKSIEELEAMAKRMRIKAIELGGAAGREGKGVHFGGSLSAIEIMAVLYGAAMCYDPKKMNSDERDRLFVGKAHCILAHLPALAEMGIITDDELLTFRDDGSPLLGYPKNLDLGLEYNGGSLGTAYSFAAGVALAYKRAGKTNHVYVLIGDGECDEGVIWETSMAAARFALDNITLVVDRNHVQLEGPTEELMPLGNLGQKFADFGWEVDEVDGHDIGALYKSLSHRSSGRPYVVIANTIKGKGISFMEGNHIWHQNRLAPKDYEKAMAELGESVDNHD